MLVSVRSICNASVGYVSRLLVLYSSDVPIRGIGLLPNLDLYSAADDTNTHCGEEIVCSVGVVIYATIKHSGRVSAKARFDYGFTA